MKIILCCCPPVKVNRQPPLTPLDTHNIVFAAYLIDSRRKKTVIYKHLNSTHHSFIVDTYEVFSFTHEHKQLNNLNSTILVGTFCLYIEKQMNIRLKQHNTKKLRLRFF